MNIHLPAILMFTRGTRFWPIPIWSWCLMYFCVDSQSFEKSLWSLWLNLIGESESRPQLLHNILGDLENPKKRKVKKARRRNGGPVRRGDLWEGGRVRYMRFWILFDVFLLVASCLKIRFLRYVKGSSCAKIIICRVNLDMNGTIG